MKRKKIIFILLALVVGFYVISSMFVTLDEGAKVEEEETVDRVDNANSDNKEGLDQINKQLSEEQKQMQNELEKLRQKVLELEEKLKNEQNDNGDGRGNKAQNEPPKSTTSGGSIDHERREEVKKALLHGWRGYEERCWGMDELKPVDGTYNNWLGLGLTIVDSLDTLWIMGLKSEFHKAREWIAANLNFNKNVDVSLFETTIRVLGGLLSAYDLSGDKMFLDKARDLGDRFLPAFDTNTGIPYCQINLATKRASNPSWTGGASILSEVGTLQLEFVYLSKHTGNPIYGEKALKAFDALEKIRPENGLYSVYVNPSSGTLSRDHITLGALGDSFYEYMIKLWILMGSKPDSKYRAMYDRSAQGIIDVLVKKSEPNRLTYIAEYINRNIHPKMDHLVCFAGGMFAIGARGDTAQKHMEIAEGVTKTCNEMYTRTATGISAELVKFQGSDDFIVPSDAKHYLLRPETVESFFVMWRKTHNPIWREMGWKAFKAIDKYCKVRYGYSGIRDVTSTTPMHDNLQQSFFLAETLKYLYLLFSEDELIPLDKYTFNTEAHPLSVFKD